MKSRKSGLFGTRTSKKRSASASSKKSTLRKGLVESLEKRELLAGDVVLGTGLFKDAASRDAWIAEYRDGNSGNSSGGPEGGAGDIINLAEQEPNTGFVQAQLVPLQGNLGVNISGVISDAADVDWFAFDLEAGDIVDGRLSGGTVAISNIPLLSMHNSTGRELVASQGLPSATADAPLTGSPSAPGNLGDVALHYVVPTDGRYYMRVSDVLSTYTLSLRQYRPTFEAEPAGTHQVLFLDFDGATVPRRLFPVNGDPALDIGSARLSPLSSFLAGYGLEASDEPALIDAVVRRTQAKFDFIAQNTTNPNFRLEILNSKDHADPWGQDNVSRMIVGGTQQELSGDPTFDIGLLGIAESVDYGNFDRTETALALQDTLVAIHGAVPVSSSAQRLEAIAEQMAGLIAHEAGHYFGGWHTDPFNTPQFIMDQFYDPFVFAGAGNDLTFGTADDVPLNFGADAYNIAGGPFLDGGINDTVNALGWGLTSGQQGGRLSGTVYQDNNLSRAFDAGDAGLAGIRVYADQNANGIFDSSEFNAFTNDAGFFEMTVPGGTYTLRQEVPAGYRLVAPADNQITVTVDSNGAVGNLNFGQELLDLNFTGSKWNDVNANGLRDGGETGIEGVWVYLDLDGDNRIDLGEPSDITDARGNYSLNFPGAGTFTIREVVPPGYVQTFPGPDVDNEHTVTLTGDPLIDIDRVAGLNFGNTLTVDFGDALASYGVASHGFVPELRLGVNWDAEQVSQHSADALGDDNNGASSSNGDKDGGSNVIDDEDGVTLVRPLVPGNNQVAVVVNNSTGSSAFLSGWIDFNKNGVFDASEKIASDISVSSGASQIVDVSFTAPQDVVLGNTFARFRLSSDAGLGPTGDSGSGEVEDYVFEVVADREFTIDDSASVTRNSVLNEIDVLANDFKLPGEQLQIIGNSGSSAGGIVTISSNNTILYTPPNGFIGQDTFTYTARNSFGDIGTASVAVDVRIFFDNPIAVDDSFDLAQNAIDFPLNVLANDIEGQNGALSIISITQPDKGGSVSIATGGKSLRYTPLRGFGGTEFFTYTVADGAGNQSTAQVTLHTLPGDRDDDDVLIQLVARNEAGEAITAIPQGQNFVIDVMVDDLRYDANNPSAAAGVFAAYADILYNLQLVSANPSQGGSLDFDVEFFSDFGNGQRGEAAVPGIIDDFGAFLTVSTLNQPDPVKMASISFKARSPGIARFMPDPSDESPATDTLLFDTSSNEVPRERIRFIGTSLEIVGDGAQFPVAVDDSLPGSINQGSFEIPIDVLANDLPGSTGAISIADFDSATQTGGSVKLNGAGTALLYTPRTDFTGTDQFTYTIQDSRGIQSSATVTVRVGDVNANDIVSLELQATDTAGNPIDEITVGSNFQLRGYVQDLRTVGTDLGIFAAYEDILYSSDLVNVIPSTANGLGFEITFGPNYQRVREGSAATPGLINELGAVSTGDAPLGNNRELFFTINLTATATGVANFIADPADISPLHDTLTYEPVQPVPFDQIRYGFDSITIIAGGNGGNGEGWHNSGNALDVNNDGFVSPIDALTVINRLNRSGSGSLGGSGEGESGGVFYVDTNNDGYLSPVDALLVINFLNSSGSGEGEALSAMLSSGVLAESAEGVESEVETIAEPQVINIVSNRILARMTDHNYGPVLPESTSGFDFSDIDEDEEEAMLDDLAADINGWSDLS